MGMDTEAISDIDLEALCWREAGEEDLEKLFTSVVDAVFARVVAGAGGGGG